MNLFIGRQPIFDFRLKTAAYELLFRSGQTNQFDGQDPSAATGTVISNAFFSLGADRVLGGRKAFINVPRELLVANENLGLPPQTVVIEILETVEPDPEVIRACHRLKAEGYEFALDDFVERSDYAPLIELADFVKIDFCATSPADRRRLCAEFTSRGIRTVAEKIETRADFESARAMGYSYVQGYFFAHPEILSGVEITVSKSSALQLLRELHQPQLDFSRIDELIRRDVSIAHRLMRFVNSAAFAWDERIVSILHALVLLGERGVRKWVTLATIPNLASDNVPELVRMSVYRARFCELVAQRTTLLSCSSECFLMGLFSLLDVMLGRPLSELSPEHGLRAEICDALCGRSIADNHFRVLFDLCLACEAADMIAITERSMSLNLSGDEVAKLYMEAMSWAEVFWPHEP
jgi:c-di-GMP-related signal transduction protein